jgi:PBP1b-binding outer membrane lipoprotein LpoB
MKNLVFFICLAFVLSSCGNDTSKLTKEEQGAVDAQVSKDQQAMDSLEKAIQTQINMSDSAMKQKPPVGGK